jgi:hypothetical protein
MMHAIDIENLQVLHQVFVSAKSIRYIALNPLTGDIAVGSSDYSIRIYDRPLIPEKGMACPFEFGFYASVYTGFKIPDQRIKGCPAEGLGCGEGLCAG